MWFLIQHEIVVMAAYDALEGPPDAQYCVEEKRRVVYGRPA